MYKKFSKLIIRDDSSIKHALNKLKESGQRCLLVVNKKKEFLGTCTDGDIRKKILIGYNLKKKIANVYNSKAFFVYNNNINHYEIKKKINAGLDLVPILNDKKRLINIISKTSTDYKKIINVKTKKKIGVIIMAGGLGKRMEPFTNILPKPLVPINGSPIIELIIRKLRDHGFLKIFISINKNDVILKSYFDKKKYKNIQFVEETKSLGPLGAITKIKDNKKSWLILNCDTYFDFNLDKMISAHNQIKSKCTVVISKNVEQSKYGHCHLNSKNQLVKIEEKPKNSFFCNVGIYLISNQVANFIPKNKYFSILDLIKILNLKKINISSFIITKKSWFDFGNWNDYNKNIKKITFSN
jgi:dTDP-glucose pyrophosphorylase